MTANQIIGRQTLDSWDDVLAFCEQRIAENATLDYKQDIPDELQNTVAAMANTLGGVIILGVQEDQQARPRLPVDGLEARRGLVEKVMSKCVDAITPPVVPNIGEYVNQAQDRALIVIRVPQSAEAPHATSKNTKVYVRTGRQNAPEELASLEKIAWISARREKAEQLREWTIVRAAGRFKTFRRGGVPGFRESRDPDRDSCMLTLAISPVYPQPTPLIRSPELRTVLTQINVPDPMRTAGGFPLVTNSSVRTVEDGVVSHIPGGDGLRTYHTHLNIHGLYFYKQSMLWHPPLGEGTILHGPAMRLSEIVDRAYCLIASARKFYDVVRYSGPVSIRLKLESFQDSALLVTDLMEPDGACFLRHSADPTIQAKTFSTTYSMNNERDEISLQLVQRVAWAFDWDIAEASLAKYARTRFPE